MRKKYIGLFDSTYSLFLFLLKYPENFKNTYFFISDGIPYCLRKKINNSYLNGKYKGKKTLIGLFVSYFYRLKILFIAKIINPSIIYGQDHLLGAEMLINKYKFHLFEDGYVNYKIKEINKINKTITFLDLIKEKIFKIKKIQPFGLEKNVEKVYLTGLAEIPEIIKSKTEIICIEQLWNEKTDEQKNQILSFYNLNTHFLSKIKERSFLLITQPLSEDEILSEEEKIDIYRNITKNIDLSELVIKVHPREKTEYKKLFPKALILDTPFPSQILKLVNISFSKIITLYSTAASDFLDEKNTLIFYGTQYDKRFVEKSGIIFYDTVSNKIRIESNN